MLKKSKVIFGVITIVLLLLCWGIIIYDLSQYTSYEGTIIGIQGNTIFASRTPEVLDEKYNYDVSVFGGSYEYAYVLFSDYAISAIGAKIKGNNGNNINISDLQVGDKIYVVYKKAKETKMVIPERLDDVKIVKVVE